MITLNKHLVLGFAGRARVGKNTLAERVAKYLWLAGITDAKDAINFGFADGIKHDLMSVFNCSFADIDKAKLNPLGRWVLEKVGTEWFGQGDLIEYLSHRVSDLKGGNKVILISDIRTPNEASFVRDTLGGFVTLVRRPQVEDGIELKLSEKNLTKIVYDFCVTNDHGLQHVEFLAKDIANQILTSNKFKAFVK